MKGNIVAVISDGTAVLGLGDIGPHAGVPVMEEKAVSFKEFADVNAVPICIDTKEELDIPVFHDDQHGTAIVVLAGGY